MSMTGYMVNATFLSIVPSLAALSYSRPDLLWPVPCLFV